MLIIAYFYFTFSDYGDVLNFQIGTVVPKIGFKAILKTLQAFKFINL